MSVLSFKNLSFCKLNVSWLFYEVNSANEKLPHLPLSPAAAMHRLLTHCTNQHNTGEYEQTNQYQNKRIPRHHLAQPVCQSRAGVNNKSKPEVKSGCSYQVLSTYKGSDCPASLGKLPTAWSPFRESLLRIKLEFPLPCNFCSCLVLPSHTSQKSMALSSLYPPISNLKTVIRNYLSLLSSRLNKFTLSPSCHKQLDFYYVTSSKTGSDPTKFSS